MKVPVLASLLSILLLTANSSGMGQDWSLQLHNIPQEVYKLQSQAHDDGGFCSAVVLNDKDDFVLTAAHCIPADPLRSLVVHDKHADVVKVNTILDLALLHVAGLGGRRVELRKDEIKPGLPIAVVGYGFAADHMKYGFGWISDARDNSLRAVGDRLYFSAAGVVPGDSGGAVLDFYGRLCTIVQGVIFAGPSSIAYGAPVSVIEDFAKPVLPRTPTP